MGTDISPSAAISVVSLPPLADTITPCSSDIIDAAPSSARSTAYMTISPTTHNDNRIGASASRNARNNRTNPRMCDQLTVRISPFSGMNRSTFEFRRSPA